MNADELPAGAMNYSFKAYVQACGFAGDLIISSTSVNDLVKSLRLLEHAGISPTAAQQGASATPICPVHQRPMKPSRTPGALFCSAKVGDDYCDQKARA